MNIMNAGLLQFVKSYELDGMNLSGISPVKKIHRFGRVFGLAGVIDRFNSFLTILFFMISVSIQFSSFPCLYDSVWFVNLSN